MVRGSYQPRVCPRGWPSGARSRLRGTTWPCRLSALLRCRRRSFTANRAALRALRRASRTASSAPSTSAANAGSRPAGDVQRARNPWDAVSTSVLRVAPTDVFGRRFGRPSIAWRSTRRTTTGLRCRHWTSRRVTRRTLVRRRSRSCARRVPGDSGFAGASQRMRGGHRRRSRSFETPWPRHRLQHQRRRWAGLIAAEAGCGRQPSARRAWRRS